MAVSVMQQRRHHPPSNLHTAAMRSLQTTESIRLRRPQRTELGVEKSYWQTIGRDDLFEQRLIIAILQRATDVVDTDDKPVQNPDF